MNGLTGATIKDYLQVRIPDPGIPTVAYSARVETEAIAVGIFGDGQTSPGASIPVAALFATTETGASIDRSFETNSVVKRYLITGDGGNYQEMLDGSIIPTSGLVIPKPENSARGCSW